MIKKPYKKTSRTNKILRDVLSDFIVQMEQKYTKQPKKILDCWPGIIGKKLAPMTEAMSFENKVLYVKVKSSTLHSILCMQEKYRLLKIMQNKFSKDTIRNIIFKIG